MNIPELYHVHSSVRGDVFDSISLLDYAKNFGEEISSSDDVPPPPPPEETGGDGENGADGADIVRPPPTPSASKLTKSGVVSIIDSVFSESK